MTAEERRELIVSLESKSRKKRKMLKKLGIPESTYYGWQKRYQEGGLIALEKDPPRAWRSWNRLLAEEETTVLDVALAHPELSPRLLAVKITDEEAFSVSESTVYRMLKAHHLIAPRPIMDLPAAAEWHHKTTRVNEIWQIDGTNFFIVNWGYYKLIPVLDDFSRKILAWELFPDETAGSISSVLEKALEATGLTEGPAEQKPKLLSDNGPGFLSDSLSHYLGMHGIHHLFSQPYHPQTKGKIERFNRTVKENLCLLVYCSPGELKEAIRETIDVYNATPHEVLDNVSPNDVYAGRREDILKRRAEKKRWTLARRRMVNLEGRGQQTTHRNAPPFFQIKVGRMFIPPAGEENHGLDKP